MVRLPFSLGSVDVGTYSVIAYLILTVLMISYCQTFAAAHIAARIVRETINSLGSQSARDEAWGIMNLHQLAPLSRVAPLALLIKTPKIAACYYCLLKLVAITVLFGIPCTALVSAFLKSINASIASWIYWLSILAFCITIVAVIQMLVVEILHTTKVTRLFWRGEVAGQIRQA